MELIPLVVAVVLTIAASIPVAPWVYFLYIVTKQWVNVTKWYHCLIKPVFVFALAVSLYSIATLVYKVTSKVMS
jgi:hypothetical protein